MSVTLSDTQLTTGLKNGDESAFTELYNNYKDSLYRFVLSLVKVESIAEDVVQQVFMNIWIKRAEFDESKNFSSYLYTIAKNSALNTLRSAHSKNKYLKEQVWQNIELHRCFTDEQIEVDEMLRQIQDSIQKLTPQQQKVFELSRKDGLSHEEIAKKTNISRNTVRNHISESIKLIKSELEKNARETSAISVLIFWFFS